MSFSLVEKISGAVTDRPVRCRMSVVKNAGYPQGKLMIPRTVIQDLGWTDSDKVSIDVGVEEDAGKIRIRRPGVRTLTRLATSKWTLQLVVPVKMLGLPIMKMTQVDHEIRDQALIVTLANEEQK